MKWFFLLIILSVVTLPGIAQRQDTLDLKCVVQRVLNTYPTIEQAREALKSAAIRTKQARSAYLPDISGSASYLWTEPISTMKFDEHAIDLEMKNSYQAGISFSQLIYDFGKSRPKVETARLQEELAQLQLNELYQSLTIQTIQSYLLTHYMRKAVRIKQEELANLEHLLKETRIKKESGSVTSFDVLNTQVKYASTESELTTLFADKNTRNTNLSLLADTLIDDQVLLEETKLHSFPMASVESLVAEGLEKRSEMREARKQYEIASWDEKTSNRLANPTLNLHATAGGKNGYLPYLDRLKLNYTVGATLNIPIYEKRNRKHERDLSRSRLMQEGAAIRLMEIRIKDQITSYYNTLNASYSKIKLFSMQVQVAKEAFRQAEINYRTGAITNLELLTSATNLSNARLQFEQEKINYQIAYYQLMKAIGKDMQIGW